MDISIKKNRDRVVTNSVGTSLNRRNRVLHLGLHHFNPPSQWKAYKAMTSLERETMCAQKDKGMQNQAYMNGGTMNYSFLALKWSSPLMHPRGSIYSPSIGSEGSSWSISRHMEGQELISSGLIEKNSKCFCFYAYFPMYMSYNGESCMYTQLLR